MQGRYGRPQFIAGALLLCFLGQCLWLVAREARVNLPTAQEVLRLERGMRLYRGTRTAPEDQQNEDRPGPAGARTSPTETNDHSALWYLIAASPLVLWQNAVSPATFSAWVWAARVPSLVFALFLGASLWYVSRRLYGNAGGYIALVIYCSSPLIIQAASLWGTAPVMDAAWGSFGAVFTAIAVAHTLYAPRDVVLWNWRRTLLLGLSFTLAIGSQFSLMLLVPLALALMLYVAPSRRGAATVIWGTALGVALLLLLASYSFRPSALIADVSRAHLFRMSGVIPGFWSAATALHIARDCPVLIVAFPIALAVYMVWPRARYFGNTAPLLVAVALCFVAIVYDGVAGRSVLFVTVPFLIVFISGVAADLLETRHRTLVMTFTCAVLVAGILWDLIELWRLAAG